MSLLLSDEALRARSAVAHAELAPLADSLARELRAVSERPLFIPTEKALLSREGGRCPRDGVMLDFDPFSPHQHRCPVCGELYTGEFHYRFWIYWYQLWLIERALHGALFATLGVAADEAASFSSTVLASYADQYPGYPNRDNVLGPTRLFFSTYLESIWLLNLCIALDLLERRDPRFAELGARIRDRIIEPSAALIASYDEGASNRQVWNAAALVAANRLLGRDAEVERALFAKSGIAYHLKNGLLADGTWYEGENYHLFAHRGFWYGVTMAESLGAPLPAPLVARFQEGFVTPFLTALPDMTLPSRRDSQYAISLRQPRFAELAELGLARESGDGDPRLRGVLYRLYANDVPRRDTGRARTAADVERNLPATALSRADLGWRSLLFARPTLPALEPEALGTVLLEAQGLAVFRRERERIYVALDYGTSGGGHGHPDRLNVLLSDGPTRWLDDMGTGSYVDPSLHWYRSTLAHNAPRFDGRDQQRVDGLLLAFDETNEAGWVCAAVPEVAPDVSAMRTLVVLADYMIDDLIWYAHAPAVIELPFHVAPSEISVGAVDHAEKRMSPDSFDDVLGVAADIRSLAVAAGETVRLLMREGERGLRGFIVSSSDARLFHFTAPGAPGQSRRPMVMLRMPSTGGERFIRSVWSWSDCVQDITVANNERLIIVRRRDGAEDRHTVTHDGWRIERQAGSMRRAIVLSGAAPRGARSPVPAPAPPAAQANALAIRQTLAFDLAADSYRRSEESWEEAGKPTARVELRLDSRNSLVVTITVHKPGALTFVPSAAVNIYDNEAPDINGDGVQLYLVAGGKASAWVLVPEAEEEERRTVRIRAVRDWDATRGIAASWRRHSGGYEIEARLTLSPDEAELALGVVVNEKPAGRERRRGQLVLGGKPGQFVYLRGDREERSELPRFAIR